MDTRERHLPWVEAGWGGWSRDLRGPAFSYLFIYFWLRWVFVAACGLSLVVATRGYSSLQLHRLLIAMAPLVKHGL